MIVQIRYKSNCIDAFDTNTFAKSEPFANANMLMDFEPLLDRLGNTGFWLATRSYGADQSYRDDATEDSIRVARRGASPFARFSASCSPRRAESETRTR